MELSCENFVNTNIITSEPKVEIHPNYEFEVGYYDISGKDNFRLYICKKPNFIQKFITKYLLGWTYRNET